MKNNNIIEIKEHIIKNGGAWDLTNDNGAPMIYDEEKNVYITDLIISKDNVPCAVIPLGHFSEVVINDILITI